MNRYATNFYAIDCETTGFKRNELVQFASVHYVNGKEVSKVVRSIMPEGEFTESALRTHGLSRKVLKQRGAKVFSKATSDMIMNYLNIMKDLPIVAHNVEYDRDKVLKPAFKKVGNLDAMPPDSRWRCTLELANKIPGLNMVTLDDALEHFGFERRDVD